MVRDEISRIVERDYVPLAGKSRHDFDVILPYCAFFYELGNAVSLDRYFVVVDDFNFVRVNLLHREPYSIRHFMH